MPIKQDRKVHATFTPQPAIPAWPPFRQAAVTIIQGEDQEPHVFASDLGPVSHLVRLGAAPASLSARANLTEQIGWHTFRRSLATLLTSKKEAVKVVQELMRHADPRITLALYAQGEEDAKRAAQKHMSGLFVVQKKAS